MSLDIESSIVLITSKIIDTNEFGSGFPIYCDSECTYILTCAHVVKDVGGVDNIEVRGIPATVVALGHELGCDLAVLKVNALTVGDIISLSSQANTGQRIFISGYYQSTSVKIRRRIDGVLGEKVSFDYKGDLTNAWDITIDEHSQDTLQPGYSGSPVIDTSTGKAIAVVTQRQGDGWRGHAISIEGIEKIWIDMPDSILQAKLLNIEQELFEENKEIQQLDDVIKQISQSSYIQENNSYKSIMNWLSKGEQIADKVGRESLKKIELFNHDSSSDMVDSFCLEIELYLEIIHTSFLTDRLDILNEPAVTQSLPYSEAYRDALILTKKRIPGHFSVSEKMILEKRLNYLIERI